MDACVALLVALLFVTLRRDATPKNLNPNRGFSKCQRNENSAQGECEEPFCAYKLSVQSKTSKMSAQRTIKFIYLNKLPVLKIHCLGQKYIKRKRR